MQERHVDVAVIGAGSAGLGAYRSALEWTPNVVMIEGGPYGTTCARVGCMPSKLLIAAAEAAHASEQASEFGVNTGSVAVDGVAVMDRVRRERDPASARNATQLFPYVSRTVIGEDDRRRAQIADE